MGASEQIAELTKSLTELVAVLPLHDKVAALNQIRAELHAVSPFASEPVDLVQWRPAESVVANEWNPNFFVGPEFRLLQHSIEADGYTQPIVAHELGELVEVVDGFHRNRVGREVPAVRERLHGYLPITKINTDRAGRADRIASTIRHNRARGEHAVGHMSEIVRMLYVAGWKDEKIAAELGMQPDEVLRLKQITGLAALFAQREYSKAWEPDDGGFDGRLVRRGDK